MAARVQRVYMVHVQQLLLSSARSYQNYLPIRVVDRAGTPAREACVGSPGSAPFSQPQLEDAVMAWHGMAR